jgi:hypothetical protein
MRMPVPIARPFTIPTPYLWKSAVICVQHSVPSSVSSVPSVVRSLPDQTDPIPRKDAIAKRLRRTPLDASARPG